MAQYKVYVTDGRHASYDIERVMLSEIGAELEVLQCATEDDLMRRCADADALLLDMAPMTAKASRADATSTWGTSVSGALSVTTTHAPLSMAVGI